MTGRIGTALHQQIKARNRVLTARLEALQSGVETVTELESYWHKLKFVVLEGEPSAYFQIRELFNVYRKESIAFAELKERVFGLFYVALQADVSDTNLVNVLTHIWGYLKKHVQEGSDREHSLLLVGQLSQGRLELADELYEWFAVLHEKVGKDNLLAPVL